MPDMSSSFLSAFLFAFPVLQLWSCFPSLVDWTFQVFGQLEYFNQRDELLFGELVIINAKGSEERTDLLFLGTALKIHRILQLTLYGCYEGTFIQRHIKRQKLRALPATNTSLAAFPAKNHVSKISALYERASQSDKSMLS